MVPHPEPGKPVNLSSLPDIIPGSQLVPPYHLIIKLAICGSSNGRLSLQEIFRAVENRYPFMEAEEGVKPAWKVSR